MSEKVAAASLARPVKLRVELQYGAKVRSPNSAPPSIQSIGSSCIRGKSGINFIYPTIKEKNWELIFGSYLTGAPMSDLPKCH